MALSNALKDFKVALGVTLLAVIGDGKTNCWSDFCSNRELMYSSGSRTLNCLPDFMVPVVTLSMFERAGIVQIPEDTSICSHFA